MTLESIADGEVLLIDKPLDWTSFDAVNFIRGRLSRMLGIKRLKVGHAGTLDPKATGLLLICTGKKTKIIDSLQGMSKTYSGTFKMGATTPCYDTERAENAWFSLEGLTEEQLQVARLPFIGDIMQIPPVFSAIKVDGKALYADAHKGKVVAEPAARPVTIHRFDITRIELPEIDFFVECSKGTYIRSLAHDYGKSLNNGAYLTALRRESIGEYDVKNAVNPEELIKMFSV